MERVEFHLNEVIFQNGALQNWMYSVSEGCVDIYSGYGTSEEKKLTTVTAGNVFGEIGMIAAMSRTATAVAAEETVVLERIDAGNFDDYLKAHPENLQAIMSSVSRRIRDLTEDLESISLMTNELLRFRDGDKYEYNLIAELVNGVVGKLKAKMKERSEYAVMQKRRQALESEVPVTVQFAKGDVIFRVDEPADCMYDIYDGFVGIYSGYQTENEKLLAKLHSEQVFGEMGILDDMPRSATAVCLSDCTVLVVKPESFMQFFRNKPAKVIQILQQMCMQLRDLTKTYLEVCKTLEQLPGSEEEEIQEDALLANLEYLRQTRMCTGMYDIYGTCGWFYDRL